MTAGVLAAAVLYVLAVRRFEAGRLRRWGRWRTAAFLAGAAAVLVAVSAPVDSLAHRDLRGHMVQHLLLGMYAPIGLVLGRPLTLLLAMLPVRAGRRVTALLRSRPSRVVAHPLAAGVLAVGSLFALYLTDAYAVSATSPLLHHLLHVHFLVAGYLFAWSVAGPDPAPGRPAMAVRVTALTLAAAAHAVLAKLLYSRAGDLPPGSGHGRAAVEQAAQWMYYGGDVAEVLLATALFMSWYRARSRVLDRAPLPPPTGPGAGASSPRGSAPARSDPQTPARGPTQLPGSRAGRSRPSRAPSAS